MDSMDWKSRLKNFVENSPELQNQQVEKASSEEHILLKKQHFRIELDKKRRNGKQATIISGFNGSESELKELAAKLKKTCAVGGSSGGGEILIQGDFRDKITSLLKEMGHEVG